jgi:hypothetical protein
LQKKKNNPSHTKKGWWGSSRCRVQTSIAKKKKEEAKNGMGLAVVVHVYNLSCFADGDRMILVQGWPVQKQEALFEK